MELSAKLKDLKKQIRRKFPRALVSVDSLPSFSQASVAARLPEVEKPVPYEEFQMLTGWPVARGRSLALEGQGATGLVWQMMGLTISQFDEAVAYVDGRGSFFPPGASLAGVDLNYLFWINTDTVPCSVRAAELLIESELFGLVVLDPPKGMAVSTGCRRLHLKLLHSSSRLVAIEHSDTTWNLPIHERLHLKNQTPDWEQAEPSCGITAFSGRAHRAVANAKRFMAAAPFHGAFKVDAKSTSGGK